MNVKKGQLAILIYCPNKDNIGKICEVVEFVGAKVFPDNVEMSNTWKVHFSHPLKIILFDDKGNKHRVEDTKVYVPDAWLRPITGLDLEEEEFNSIPKTEVAD